MEKRLSVRLRLLRRLKELAILTTGEAEAPMAKFVINQTVSLPDGTVEAEGLGVGPHRFQLIAVDDDGQESDPAFLDVVITAGDRPTAVLDLTDANGQRINSDTVVGRRLFLSGARSSDVEPGRIVEYRYTLIS